ncbi:MAG: pitrilysin family protein [Pseudomonadota bacterium]
MTVEVTTLANGLRVVTEEMPHLETASLGFWVGAGSRDENADENGISHLLEHMAFKGTARRNALEIAEAIENVGGDINAATSLETTAYYARVLREDVALAVDVIADILQNSVFDPDELAREKDVIFQEIAAALDTPDDLVFDTAQSLAFAEQSVGRSILGTPETLAGFDSSELRRYLAKHYHPSRIVVSAAGAVSHAAIVGMMGEHFSGSSPGNSTRGDGPAARFTGGARHVTRAIEQSHIVLGWSAPPLGTPEYYAAQVFAGMLGGGMSSRLFQKAREERGLCYSIYAYCWGLIDAGLFSVYAASSREHIAELADVINGEIADIAASGATATELARAKAQLKSGLLMGLESSSMRAEQMARHLLSYGHVLSSKDLIQSIDAVDTRRIAEFADRLAGAEATVWSEVGPERAALSAPVGRGERQRVAALS